MSVETTPETPLTHEQAHDRADAFVVSMNRTERVVWLQYQGVSDLAICDALLDPDDPDLDEFTRERAHAVASAAVNGSLAQEPPWLE